MGIFTGNYMGIMLRSTDLQPGSRGSLCLKSSGLGFTALAC